MAFSARVEYTGDGSSNAWTVSFPYLKKSHVTLTVDGVPDATFTWITDSSIAATSIPGDGLAVVIQRVTPRNALDTTIPASGTFRGADLNNQATQALFVADEAYDEISVPTSGTLITGTPADNQIPVFVSANTIEGGSGLTYDGSELGVTGDITVTGNVDGVDVATLKTDFDALTHDGLSGFVANEHIDWTSTSSNLTTTGNVTADDVFATRIAGNAAAGFTPGGRLTATSTEPEGYSTVLTGTAIYYAPYKNNKIPVYDGANWFLESFGELTNTFSDTTKNPAAVGASTCYDMFVWNDAGTMRLSRGPAWTSYTARSAGSALARLDGVWVNNVAIANGPAQYRGTYVGTFRSNGSSQLKHALKTAGANAVVCGLWNAYNRRSTSLYGDGNSVGSHTYNSLTVRPLGNNFNFRFIVVAGIGSQEILLGSRMTSSTGGLRPNFGFGDDSSSSMINVQAYGNGVPSGSTDSAVNGTPVFAQANCFGAKSFYVNENATGGIYTAFPADSFWWAAWEF